MRAKPAAAWTSRKSGQHLLKRMNPGREAGVFHCLTEISRQQQRLVPDPALSGRFDCVQSLAVTAIADESRLEVIVRVHSDAGTLIDGPWCS
jgi:hypothetical protein